MLDAHQVSGVLHHDIDGLVSVRNLVDEVCAVTKLDPLHPLPQILVSEPLPGLGPRELPTGTVRSRAQAGPGTLADHHVRARSHRSGNDRPDTLVRVHCTFTGEPHVLLRVRFLHRVIVVAIDPLGLAMVVGSYPLGEHRAEPVHHLGPVQVGETLSPLQFSDVLPEFTGALGQVCQIFVGQRDPPLRAQTLGNGDVLLGDLVAHAPRSTVQKQPHSIGLVEAQLGKMIAAAQRTELLTPLR